MAIIAPQPGSNEFQEAMLRGLKDLIKQKLKERMMKELDEVLNEAIETFEVVLKAQLSHMNMEYLVKVLVEHKN